MKNKYYILILLIFIMIFFGCDKKKVNKLNKSEYIFEAPISTEKIPDDVVWLTNDTDPIFSSPDAKKGGILRGYIINFPNTFRTVGPDSNNSFRSYILDNQLSLINLHPNTENIIPELATHWAFDKDKKTMYFKLNKSAKWSDGMPVTAHDFAYTLEFMRSKHIVAPWYNDFYTEYIDKVIVYDDYTLAVKATRAMPDLHFFVGISPTPRHYYSKLDENFVKDYNWKIVPNTGPYNITKFKKGESVVFERKKNWWGENLRYNKNRFNVDKVIFTVIKDTNMIWEYFKKGKIDVFPLYDPEYWYKKSDIPIFQDGYAVKLCFFNDTRRSPQGFYLNQDKDIFKDQNVRYAFAYGMNVKKVIEKILRNDYYRLEHAYVGYGKYSNNKIKARRYDLDKVEYYMKKSGWKRGDDGIWVKNGLRFSVEVSYSLDSHTSRLVVFKEEALKAGIELKLDKLDGAANYKKVMEKKHDVAYWGWSTNERPSYWQVYHSDNAHKSQTNNITNTDDPELDKLINKYRNSISEKERIELSLIIQEKLHEICAYVPTFMMPFGRQGYWRWWRLPEIPATKNSETSFYLDDSAFDPFGANLGGRFWFDEKLYKDIIKKMKNGIKMDPVTIIDKTYKMDNIK